MPLVRRATTLLSTVPLRARLVGILLVSLVTALALTGYGVQRVLENYLVQQVDDTLTSIADQVAQDRDLGIISAYTNQRSAFQIPSLRFQLSVDGVGTVVYGGAATQDPTAPHLFPVLASGAAAQQQGHRGYSRPYTVRATDGSWWRVVVFRPDGTFRLTDDSSAAPASVTVAESLTDTHRVVERLRLLIVLVGATATAACVLLGWLAIRRAFRPLREVERTAAAIAAGDLSQRVPPRPATTEVGRLTSSLNIMLSRIESAFRSREASEQRTRRFAADASHELRTPLASIRGFAELYRQGAVPPDEVPRTMRRIEDEATRMGGLVEDLLMLARLDEQRSVRTDPVDLTVLANDAVHDARGLDSDRRLRLIGLDSGGPSPAVVIGDEDRLRQVVANLMANAIRHTPAGSPIEVAVGTRAAAADQAGAAPDGARFGVPRTAPPGPDPTDPDPTDPIPAAPGAPRSAGSTQPGSTQASTKLDAPRTGGLKLGVGRAGMPRPGTTRSGAGRTTTPAAGMASAVAVIEVRDHGPGLSEDQAAKIFERFYRVDPSRQRGRGGGSGLGLSIVAAVVAAHHGQVEVRQTPGGGATFIVTLPVAPANLEATTVDV